MKTLKQRTLGLLTAFAVLSILMPMPNSTAFADLLSGNPGFETAGGGGATDSDLWNEFAAGAAGTLSERDSSNPFAGSFAHHLLAIGDDTQGATAGINQNSIADVGFLSLQENTTVSAEFQWNGNLGPGGVAFGALRILNGVGAIVADTGLVALPNTGGSYQLVSLGSLNVPAFGGGDNDTYAAFLEINVSAGAFAGSTSEGYVDNVNVQGLVVPEPTAATLLCVGFAGMLIRRRR